MNPTRELAEQTQKVMLALGDYMSVQCHACIGGKSIGEDIRRLDAGVHAVSGTPGRVFDMIQRRNLRTRALKMLVIDEGDEMLSRGFKEQIYDIYRYLPPATQVVLISATLPQGDPRDDAQVHDGPDPHPREARRVDARGHQAVLCRCAPAPPAPRPPRPSCALLAPTLLHPPCGEQLTRTPARRRSGGARGVEVRHAVRPLRHPHHHPGAPWRARGCGLAESRRSCS